MCHYATENSKVSVVVSSPCGLLGYSRHSARHKIICAHKSDRCDLGGAPSDMRQKVIDTGRAGLSLAVCDYINYIFCCTFYMGKTASFTRENDKKIK